MRNVILIFVALIGLQGYNVNAQSIYLATGGNGSFFSVTNVENIDAKTNSLTSVFNTATEEIVFTVPLRTFKFKSSLMEEHFNEKYVESDKYPNATFKGKINETIDWTKDGIYDISSTGIMNLHGVDQTRTEKGKATVKEGNIIIDCTFNIKLTDYKIEVPKLVMSNIAPDLDIKVNCTYAPYKKVAK